MTGSSEDNRDANDLMRITFSVSSKSHIVDIYFLFYLFLI